VIGPEADELQLLLAEAFVLGNVPFAFADNPLFKEYQKKLCARVYNPPSRQKVANQLLPILGARIDLEMSENLKDKKFLTLSLDGWTDSSRSSVFACMLLKGAHFKEYLGNLQFHLNTADNIRAAVKKLLSSKLDISSVAAVVTDSPSTMVKFRRDFTEEYPHILNLR
jgi:hypothetical protein